MELPSTSLSDDGFTEFLLACGCGGALVISWIIFAILIFFPQHDTEFYRRRLVENMPRARDETLPTELQLQSTIDSISSINTQQTQASQTLDTAKEDDILQPEGAEKNKLNGDVKDKKQEKPDNKKPVLKLEHPEKPGKKAQDKPNSVDQKNNNPEKKNPLPSKPSKDAQKKEGKKLKDDKGNEVKANDAKAKEKDKKKKK